MAVTAKKEDHRQAQSKEAPLAAAQKGAVGNAISLDAENPLPIEINSSIFVSLKGKKYVPFLNPTDSFGQLLTEAKLLSPTTKSCVDSKSQFCAGKGVFLYGRRM